MIRKILEPELLTEFEIQQIEIKLNQYYNKEILFLHLLKFFGIDRFANYYYEYGNKKFKELVTEEQSDIAILFSYHLDSLLLYKEFKHWVGVKNYVENIYNNNKVDWAPNDPVDFPLVDFSSLEKNNLI